MFIVAKFFAPDARFNAASEGLPEINLIQLPDPQVPLKEEIEERRLGDTVADGIIEAFKTRVSGDGEVMEFGGEAPVFIGDDYADAVENMEKFFLQRCWSDGFPVVPPTRTAVARMLSGTDLPPDHVVARIEPKGAPATVEKIAVNAVMAGCRPHYMPVLIAAVEALADPRFDLRGVQCTAGLTSPLLLISGRTLIEQINANDSFSAIGPGWRANSTIGRAVRLVMINLGYSWPGKSDMKSFGSPFKNVILMAENEEGYQGAWEPLGVAEGFGGDQATVSAIAAVTWQMEYLPPEIATTSTIQEMLGRQARVKYDKEAGNWGMDNLVVMNPTAFRAVRNEGLSRKDFQRLIYDAAHVPGLEFFEGKEPKTEVGPAPIPQEIVDRVKTDPHALVPLLRSPDSLKVVVAGAPGPAMMAYVSAWGYGLSYFVTRPIDVPRNWEGVLAREKGWETPIVKRAMP